MTARPLQSPFTAAATILLAFAAVLSSGCHFAMLKAKASRSSSFTVPVTAKSECRIESRNGTIRCVAGDVPEISVEAEITARAGTQAEAENRLEQISIDVMDDAGVADIAANTPKGVHGSVSMIVTVPYEMSLDVITSNGTIDINGVSGSTRGKTSNGTILITDCEGPIDLSTSNGKLAIRGAFLQNIRANTSNGSVEVDGALAPGQHKITTSNGSIRVTTNSIPVAVTGTTSNGSIKVNGKKVKKGETVMVGLSSGVALASHGDAATLELRTSNGSISVNHREEPPVEIETVIEETESVKISAPL